MSIPDLKTQLAELIALPSISSASPRHDMGNLAVIERLAQWLETLGFAVRILPLPDNPNKANLLATLGTGPGGLVLAGHTDTVPCDEQLWDSSPFTLSERDNRFYGLGATDMKGFFPIAIEAARTFLDTPLKQPLMILATADEESSMAGARALASQGFPKARYAVIGEPTGLRPIRMHKGIMMEAVRLQGRSGHSSDPALGRSALDAMHDVMTELVNLRKALQSRYQHSGFTLPTPTLNLGCIHGGDNPNRICGQCELQFDLRGVPGMHNDELRQQIRQRLQPIADHHQVNFELVDLMPGIEPFEQDADSDLVKAAEQLSGHQADAVAFGTEAGFMQQLGMETIVMGPGSIDVAHQPNEYLAHEQIVPAVELLRGLIKRFCL
ncbi:acetylornithine deacetylase [Litorivivens sp.]|uniref:acetylornithine deacetylase n=2 Tax=Litorivivens sp. TaxID=2020868 RepID=UPI0035676C59